MTHFIGAVLVPAFGHDSRAYLTDVLHRFDENRAVPIYPGEPDPAEIARAAKHYGVDTVTPELMNDWDGRDWHLIDDMLIPFSTHNPESKFDYWQIGGRWADDLEPQQNESMREFSERITAVAADSDDTPEPSGFIPKHIVIPSGPNAGWHSAEDVLWFGMATEAVSAEQWHLHLLRITGDPLTRIVYRVAYLDFHI